MFDTSISEAEERHRRLWSRGAPAKPPRARVVRIVHLGPPAPEPKPSTPYGIAKQVCAAHGVTMREILCPYRDKRLVLPRQEIFYRCRTELKMSLPAIAHVFNRDHTTILHGIRRHKERMAGHG